MNLSVSHMKKFQWRCLVGMWGRAAEYDWVCSNEKSHGWRSLAGTVHGVPQSQTQLSNFTLVMKLKVKESESEGHSVVSDSVWPHGLYSPWNSPGQNTGVCSLSLLQGLFPTQVSNPGLAHCRQILYQLSHKGSPRILEWVA